LETVMRIGFVVAVLLLLGAQTGPASAGALMSLPMSMLLPCTAAATTNLSRNLCREVAAVMLGPASGLGLAFIEPMSQQSWTLGGSGLPPGLVLPAIPGQRAAWRRPIETVVARYDGAFGAGGAVDVPAAPAVLWLGGDPFAARAAD
jgi:hypothetical protein